MSKVSIRFFDDREVRAIWNEDQNISFITDSKHL